MKKQEIPIMFCFDNNYVIPAAVAFYSLLEHCNKNYYYKMYILHTDITVENQEKLKENIKEFSDISELIFVDMDNKFEDLWETISTKGHFSKEVMYKILVPSIFPQYDKIIVSDVDVVFLGDISPSYFHMDSSENYYLDGVKVIGKMQWYVEQLSDKFTPEEIEKLSGFCGGYIVFNLKKLRNDNMEQKFIKCFEVDGHRINQMEQDVLNLCCYPNTKRLPLKYLACSYMWDIYTQDEDKNTDIHYSKEEIDDAMNNTVQLHYATSKKPWKNVDCTKSEVWFEYLLKTNFAEQYFKELPYKIVLPDKRLECIAQENKEVLNEEVRDFYIENYTIRRRIIDKLERCNGNRLARILKSFIEDPLFPLRVRNYRKVANKIAQKITKQNYNLIIIDNIFPSFYSPTRTEEFLSYMNYFKNVYICATWKDIPTTEELSDEELISKFEQRYSNFQGSIINCNDKNYKERIKSIKNKIAILTYYKNIEEQIDFIEQEKIPFMFTLYPDKYCRIDDRKYVESLKKIFKSKYFKKVIITQRNLLNFVKKIGVNNNKIIYIPGMVIQSEMFTEYNRSKKYFKKNKATLDICFADYEHFSDSRDDGYEMFVKIAERFKENNDIKFHVIGKHCCNKKGMEITSKNITYHGILCPEDCSKLYKKMDIMMSINNFNHEIESSPNELCIHAMLSNMLVMCTTQQSNKLLFKDKKDFIRVERNIDDIISKINQMYDNPKQIVRIANRGRNKARKIYSEDVQIEKRIQNIRKIAKKIKISE